MAQDLFVLIGTIELVFGRVAPPLLSLWFSAISAKRLYVREASHRRRLRRGPSGPGGMAWLTGARAGHVTGKSGQKTAETGTGPRCLVLFYARALRLRAALKANVAL